jgi:hypothetical protein
MSISEPIFSAYMLQGHHLGLFLLKAAKIAVGI